jgi:hypothetical protein
MLERLMAVLVDGKGDVNDRGNGVKRRTVDRHDPGEQQFALGSDGEGG